MSKDEERVLYSEDLEADLNGNFGILEEGEQNESQSRIMEQKSDMYTVIFQDEVLYIDSKDWRRSTKLRFQLVSCYSVFILFGLAEQTVGTLIPILQTYYNMGDTQTSLIYLANVAGYFIMALVNNISHENLGYRGVITMGVTSMTLCYLIVSFKPPYAVFVFCYILNGIGFGSLDASLNTWIGNLIDSNQLLGILHGCYGIGCMISPSLITHLLEKKNNPWVWNHCYVLLSIVSSISLALVVFNFKNETPKKFQYSVIQKSSSQKDIEMSLMENEGEGLGESVQEDEGRTVESASFFDALKSKLVWLFSIILFLYVGGEVAFGQWLVTFLLREKKLSYRISSFMATTFWSGLTVGRIGLGFVTVMYFKTELNANMVYIFFSFLFYFIFWALVSTNWNVILFIVVFSAGLFTGPIFPTTIISSINVLPAKYHTSGVGFVCAFGGGGAAALPFLIGLIAESTSYGLMILPLSVMMVFGVLSLVWFAIFKKYRESYSVNHTI